MDGETLYFKALIKPKRAEREAMGEASDLLKKPGNLTLSIQSLLFCLLSFFVWITAAQMLAIPVEYALGRMTSVAAMMVLDGIYYVVIGALLLFVVFPVFLGRLRLAGRMCTGDVPMVREVLYYFSSAARYRRALVLSLILTVQVLLPVLLCALAFYGAFELYFQVFFFEFSSLVSALLLIAALLVALALSVGVLLLTGLFQMTAAIAVGNEALSVFGALRLALRKGSKRLGTLFRFSMRSLWHLLLSLVTLGVLFVLWYAHHYIISYMRLSMALCPKGETRS